MEMVQGVEEEVAQYVRNKPRQPHKDDVEAQLLSETVAQPHNVKAKKKYLEYVGKKAKQNAQKRLRKFRNTAAPGGKTFYQDLKSWLKASVHAQNKHPTDTGVSGSSIATLLWQPASRCRREPTDE